MENLEQGYAEERFRCDVDEDLHCPICLNVLKDPFQCQNNEHHFCSPCIKRHLENFQTCPNCQEELSLETLKKPARYLTRSLSKLTICCEYVHRGCEMIVKSEELKLHLANCKFAPVKCSNDGCTETVNRQDLQKHETELCKYRKTICDGCEEMKKKMQRMEEQLHHQEEIIKALSLSAFGRTNTRQDIIVAGGRLDQTDDFTTSVELFRWSDRKWRPLQSMKENHELAPSFIYNNEMIVLGTGKSQNIEALKIDREPAQWYTFPAKLPLDIAAQKAVIYNDRLILTGGFSPGDRNVCDCIYEVCLTPPYTSKLLTRIPQPRGFHGAELSGDTILIIGGAKNKEGEEIYDSVVAYDLKSNQFEQKLSLPFAVCGFATVTWGDNVIVVGGCDNNKQPLNTVIMYNMTTGKSKMLPAMKQKRVGCAAVVTGNIIVVIGGINEKKAELNTVEYFSFDSYSWNYLPPMNKGRACPTAQAV